MTAPDATRGRAAPSPGQPPPDGALPATCTRSDLRAEVLLLLGVSLGVSAVFSLVRIIGLVTAGKPLGQSRATLNGSYAPGRPWLDLALQLVSIGAGVVPALFAVHLLRRTGVPRQGIGLDGRRPAADLALGGLLAAVVGIPGLLLYLAAHAVGASATVVPAALPQVWWQVPVLVLAAGMNAVLEEVVVVGYLLVRLPQLGWSPRRALVASALLRGSYHLYQGFGGFVGNAVMGLVFGRLFQRSRRVMPLVVAHTVLDVVSFVGYALLHGHVGWLP